MSNRFKAMTASGQVIQALSKSVLLNFINIYDITGDGHLQLWEGTGTGAGNVMMLEIEVKNGTVFQPLALPNIAFKEMYAVLSNCKANIFWS